MSKRTAAPKTKDASKSPEEATQAIGSDSQAVPTMVPQTKNLINVYDVNTVKYTLDNEIGNVTSPRIAR